MRLISSDSSSIMNKLAQVKGKSNIGVKRDWKLFTILTRQSYFQTGVICAVKYGSAPVAIDCFGGRGRHAVEAHETMNGEVSKTKLLDYLSIGSPSTPSRWDKDQCENLAPTSLASEKRLQWRDI